MISTRYLSRCQLLKKQVKIRINFKRNFKKRNYTICSLPNMSKINCVVKIRRPCLTKNHLMTLNIIIIPLIYLENKRKEINMIITYRF